MRFELRGVVDVLPGLVWTALPNGQSDFVNRRWCEFTGLAPGAALGLGWRSAIHPEDLAEFQTVWESVLQSGVLGQAEARLQRSDGTYRWFVFRLAPLTDADGNNIALCGIASDSDERGALQQLSAPDRRLHRFVDGLAAQVIFMTPAGELEFVNREVLNYSGRSFSELAAWQFSDVIHRDDLAAVLDDVARAFASGAPYDRHQRMRRFDGVYRWFRARMVPSKDAEGNIVRWCAIMTEVEDLKRAEDLLAGEVRLLEMVARDDPLAEVMEALCHLVERIAPGCLCSILIVDPTGTCFRVGGGPSLPDSYTRILNGKTIDPTYGPCSLAVVKKRPIVTADLALDPRWEGSVWPLLMSTYELRSCWSMPILSRDGKALGVFAIYRREPQRPTETEQQLIDRFTSLAGITIERNQADAAVRRSETYLAEAQRLSLTGSFSWRPASDEHFWSEETFRIFGIDSSSDVSLTHILQRIHPDDEPLIREVLGEAERGADFDVAFRVVMPDGAIKYVQVLAHAHTDRDGTIEYLGAIQDVTERRLAEDALNKARSELAHVARVSALGAVTASIAHEVNQPLAGIITNANTCVRLLSTDPPDVARALETARRTIRDGNRAADVITRLRALFAKKDVAAESVDLNDAAREVLTLCSGDLEAGRVILKSRFADDLPAVNGDRVQLQQVILNLLLNAADAMAAVGDRPHDLLLTTESDADGMVRLSVRDVGVGFAPGVADKVFDPFYTTKTTGMGVGLSVSRSIIESHEGRIGAEENEGPGVTFFFSIPGSPGEVLGGGGVASVRSRTSRAERGAVRG